MKKIKISKETARDLAINAQLLDRDTTLPAGKQGILQTIEKLGYVQIDTIAAVRRSHHHTLWIRRNDYDEELLHELQSRDRAIFEYWGHAMSYLPMSDYPFCLPRMNNFRNPSGRWARHQLDKYGHLAETVLERIWKEGPLSAKDFEAAGKRGGTWWDWKPAKFVLEFLFWRGDLMIAERRNFQKIYDLTERVLPGHINTALPDDDELGQFFVRRGLSAYGVATEKDLCKYMQPDAGRDSDWLAVGEKVILKSLRNLLEAGEVLPVSLEGDEKNVYYSLRQSLENHQNTGSDVPRVSLLSPFDNLIIHRDRVKRLFDFEYSLECYLPEAKRKYGYFVFPILWGNDLVGRLDPRADRARQVLNIRNLVFEPGFENLNEFLPEFAKKLWKFARFNGCEKIEIEKAYPLKLKKVLPPLLKKHGAGG